MSNTPNYNLYLTDSATELFLDWRTKINGTENSNMVKIDAALGAKADKSDTVSVTLAADNWSGASAPYYQTITVAGMKAESNGSIALAGTATGEQTEAARSAVLGVSAQNDNSITISANGILPSCDIPAIITILG